MRPDLPDPFIRVVDRALEESPERRYESAGALESALARVLPAPEQQPSRSKTTPTLKILLAAFAILVLGLGSVTVYRLGGFASTSLESRAPSAASAPAIGGISATPVATGDPTLEYRIDAAFYREETGAVERLTPGMRLAPDESLSLQVELSAPAYVYVINEDERGESYLLFPLPGLALSNPLPAGQRHRLPGMWNSESISWQVTTAGQREHFLIVASPERSPAFEELFATLPQPTYGKPVLKLSPDELGVLRSVGGLTASPSRGDRQLRLMPENFRLHSLEPRKASKASG